MRSRYDAVVVGGGHNGLVAAFYLARAGYSVAVLERREVVGGPAATVEYFPGYRSAITNSPGSLEPKIVSDMKLDSFGLRWMKPDPAVVMPFPDGRFFVGWRDQGKVREHIARHFSARDAEAYPRVFEFFNDFARRLGISLFDPPPSMADIASRLKTTQDEADFATVFFGSIRHFLEQRLETDEIRTAIAMLSMAGAVSPSTPGTPLALMQRPMSLVSSNATGLHDPRNQPMRGSTGLPLGGMGAIIEAMEGSIRALGVDVFTETAVRSVAATGGAAHGVVLEDGREIAADIVLSNLDPRTTLLSLLGTEHVPSELAQRLAAIPAGGSTFKVVLGVDEPPHFAGVPAELADAFSTCQLRIAPDMAYLEKAHQDYVAGIATDSPRLLGLVPSFIDPNLAPAGKHLISFNAWYFPYELSGGKTWESERDVVGDRIVDILASYIPSLKRSIVARRYFSPVDLEQEYGLIAGNFSHIDMTPAHMFGLRPVAGLSDYRTPVTGLYLCGSGVWPGGTVTGLPGHNAAQKALRDLAAHSNLKEGTHS